MLQDIAKKFIATSFATSAMIPIPMGHGKISVQLCGEGQSTFIVSPEVLSFIDKDLASTEELEASEAYQTMLASEQVLKKDWDHPEEDAAWANL